MEQVGGLLVVALAAMDEPEIGDDARLVLRVAEVVQDVPRFLEMLKGGVFGAAVGEREAEVVECQRLGVGVSQVADDREGGPMAFGRLLGLAVPPELRADRVELLGTLAGVDRMQLK